MAFLFVKTKWKPKKNMPVILVAVCGRLRMRLVLSEPPGTVVAVSLARNFCILCRAWHLRDDAFCFTILIEFDS